MISVSVDVTFEQAKEYGKRLTDPWGPYYIGDVVPIGYDHSYEGGFSIPLTHGDQSFRDSNEWRQYGQYHSHKSIRFHKSDVGVELRCKDGIPFCSEETLMFLKESLEAISK